MMKVNEAFLHFCNNKTLLHTKNCHNTTANVSIFLLDTYSTKYRVCLRNTVLSNEITESLNIEGTKLSIYIYEMALNEVVWGAHTTLPSSIHTKILSFITKSHGLHMKVLWQNRCISDKLYIPILFSLKSLFMWETFVGCMFLQNVSDHHE